MSELKGYLDEYYPYVCTCKTEADKFSALLGGNEETAAVMSACSEKAQQKGIVNKQSQLLNLVFRIQYPGGDAGPWSNSTIPDNSNVTFTSTEASALVGGVVGGLGWDVAKLNVS